MEEISKRGRKPFGINRIQVQVKNYPENGSKIISKSLTICNTSVEEIFDRILKMLK